MSVFTGALPLVGLEHDAFDLAHDVDPFKRPHGKQGADAGRGIQDDEGALTAVIVENFVLRIDDDLVIHAESVVSRAA